MLLNERILLFAMLLKSNSLGFKLSFWAVDWKIWLVCGVCVDLCVLLDLSGKVLMGASFSIRWTGSNVFLHSVFLYSNTTSESETASYKCNEIEFSSSVLHQGVPTLTAAFTKVTLAQSAHRAQILMVNSFSLESYNDVAMRVFS